MRRTRSPDRAAIRPGAGLACALALVLAATVGTLAPPPTGRAAGAPRQVSPRPLYLPLVHTNWVASSKLPLVAQVGGLPAAMAAWDHYVYLAYHGRVEVVDVADPARPALAGVAAPVQERYVRGLAASDGLVYLVTCTGCDDGGQPETSFLHVLDARDATTPRFIASLRFEQIVGNPGARDGHVYLSSNDGLVVVDVKDPAQPQVVRAVLGVPWQWVFAADRLVAAGWDGLLSIYSLVDPATPAWERDLSAGAAGDLQGLVAAGLLVIADIHNPGGRDSTLLVVDVGGARPKVVGRLPLAGNGVAGAWAGQRLFVPRQAKLYGVDLSDPAHPIVVGQTDIPYGAWALTATASHAVMASGRGLVTLFDAPQATGPHASGSYGAPLGGDIYGAAAADGRLFVKGIASGPEGSRAGRVDIVDVSAPRSPKPLGSWDAEDAYGDVELLGDRMYLGGSSTVQIVDVGDPAQPQLLGNTAADNVQSLVPAGALAVGIRRWGKAVQLFDVSDVGRISPMGPLRPASGDWLPLAAVTPDARTVYALASNYGGGNARITVLDITNLLAGPQPLATIDGGANAMAANDAALYVATTRGLMVYDTQRRDQPRWVRTLDLPVTTLRLLDDGRQLASAGDGWLHVLDLADPLQPALLAAAPVPDDSGPGIVQGGAILWYWGRNIGWYGFRLGTGP